MNMKKNLVVPVLILVFAGFAFGQRETQHTLYGVNFLNPGQTLRVALENPRLTEAEIIPCVRAAVVFDIYAASDAMRLRLARRVTRETLLCAGEAAIVDFTASRTGEHVGAGVVFRCEDSVCDGSVRLALTAGLRESGRTILSLPAVVKGFDPQPDPPNQP